MQIRAVRQRTCAIYGLRRSDNSEIRYIGQTMGAVEFRLSQHYSQATNGRKSPLSGWIRKAFADGVSVEAVILESEATWNVAERNWISKFRIDGARLLNLTDGGQGSARQGRLNTQAKLSEADIVAIRASKLSSRTLAKQFGISEPNICVIRSGSAWQHVGGVSARKERGSPLRKFFDGEEPLPSAIEAAVRYQSGETMEAIAAAYQTTRPTLLRMFRMLGVKARDGGVPKRPLVINGKQYSGVLAAMKGEKISHAALMRQATFQ
ncbi:hypothetical protein C7441_11030 [Pseudaminobacter salicylatoxidans]|uniref:GIY-YIG domain-containing protein n=1 Tax=Pseudaminobacter salicylatoxidans TaxID=93369 RepID=A0A316C516_PSESE|nr:GIY-YIG nuclease family protein [Pseudaminobacter salicylatoxidans]PWJ81498.1 hypothetical protein C7441_11030 [Pseudaminobacter salicylatoxidans]